MRALREYRCLGHYAESRRQFPHFLRRGSSRLEFQEMLDMWLDVFSLDQFAEHPYFLPVSFPSSPSLRSVPKITSLEKMYAIFFAIIIIGRGWALAPTGRALAPAPLAPNITVLALSAAPACQWTYYATESPEEPAVAIYDISGLRDEDADFEGEDSWLTYHVNVCGPVVDASECGTASMCSYWLDNDMYYNQYGSFERQPLPVWSVLDADDPSAGIQLAFTNGKAVCGGHIQKTILSLACDPEIDGSSQHAIQLTLEEDWQACIIYFYIPSKFGCPLNPGAAFHHATALSGGTVFLIVAFAAVATYLIVGISVRRCQGHTGCQVCPHRNFWCSALPMLVADGCRYTVSKLRRQPADAYASVN
jgi:hypothetical protein